MVRVGSGGRGAGRGALTAAAAGDELLRPALELAVEVARAGQDDVPPVPAPRSLVRFLSFRRPLPDRALAAVRRVVDEDEELRARVLVAAGSEEALGRPSWLFLSRPAGWEAELSAAAEAVDRARAAAASEREETSAVRRLSAAESARGRAEAEREAARAEIADLRARLADERRGRALAETDLGRVRARLAGLESALAKAERRLAEPEPASVPQAPAERAAPVEPPPPPEVDAAAVAAALARARAAAGELTAALGAASSLVQPARARGAGRPAGRVPVPLPPMTYEDTVEAAEFLVRVPGVVVVVDGYNVTKLGRPELSLPEQRRWLLDAATALAARTGAEVELVFDGDEVQAPADRSRRTGVEVRFSPAGVEADDVVLELAALLPAERPVVVASNDRRVQTGARRVGANVVTSDQLLAVLGVARRPPG